MAGVSLRRQHLDKDLMGTKGMSLGLFKEMCFRKGEKQQESLHVGVAKEQRYTSLTGAAGVNTRLIGNECRTVMEERD